MEEKKKDPSYKMVAGLESNVAEPETTQPPGNIHTEEGWVSDWVCVCACWFNIPARVFLCRYIAVLLSGLCLSCVCEEIP